MPYREPILSSRKSSRGRIGAWVQASEHVLNSVVEANRAALAAFGFTGDRDDVDGVRRGETDWTFERAIETPGELNIGDTVRFTKSIDDADVLAFAQATGDTNPLHLDDDFAERSRFGGRIAHGGLVSGVISAALARLPGQVVYLSQETQFLNPVEPGDTVTATVEVTEVLGEDRYRLSTTVRNDEDRPVVEGEAVVLVDELPEETTDPR